MDDSAMTVYRNRLDIHLHPWSTDFSLLLLLLWKTFKILFKYSFIKTSDKPQMNTTATTGISDAGAAPVGTNYNVCR